VFGVSGLETAVGLAHPFYNYRVSTIVHASRNLNVWKKMSLLNISNDLTGYAELCSLLLHPGYRARGNGMLLSKARFMFLAQFASYFPQRELSGNSFNGGRCKR
jgi:arginine N-succinyltransferase